MIEKLLLCTYVPESATRSLTLRPLLRKSRLRDVKFEEGPGMFPLTSDARETFPSFLPVKTSHKGVGDCKIDPRRLSFSRYIFPS